MRWRPALAIVILLLTAVLAAAVFADAVELGSFAGPYRISHWAAWIGALFVAIYAPAYYFLRRARPKSAKLLLEIHSFGFLLAFLLITAHLAGQLSRPPQAYPELGEGIAIDYDGPSIGAILAPADQHDVDAVLALADAAMYAIKRLRRADALR